MKGAEHPSLRGKARAVERGEKRLLPLLRDLLDTVVAARGVGLAAPQIDIDLRVCIARIGGQFLPLINPRVAWRSAEEDLMEEGCLSLPDTWVSVPRAATVVLEYCDERWRPHERKVHDIDARIVQHELDHLDGVLIVDYERPGREGQKEATAPDHRLTA